MKLDTKDLLVTITPAIVSLVGIMKKEYPLRWGNYFSAILSVDGLVLNFGNSNNTDRYKEYYPIINMNKENFDYLLSNKIITQPIKVRVFKKKITGVAIIDERIPQEYYRLWDGSYCNSMLSDNDLVKVANNLTKRFTSLDDNLEYIYNK